MRKGEEYNKENIQQGGERLEKEREIKRLKRMERLITALVVYTLSLANPT